MPSGRKKLMKLLNLSWLLILFVLINFAALGQIKWSDLLSTWEGWLVLLSLLALAGTGLYRTWLFHFNENGKNSKNEP